MNVVINLNVLDINGLKPAHINLWLNLIRLSNDDCEVTISVRELATVIKCKNLSQVIQYVNDLKDNELVSFAVEKGVSNTYRLNSKYFMK